MKLSTSKYVWVSLVFIGLCVGIQAQSGLNTKNVQGAIVKSFDNERLAVSTVALTFTASKINPVVADKPASQTQAQVATCVNGGNSIVILTTGGTPSTTNGLTIAANQSFTVYGYDDISNFKTIRNSGDSNLDCVYSRLP